MLQTALFSPGEIAINADRGSLHYKQPGLITKVEYTFYGFVYSLRFVDGKEIPFFFERDIAKDDV